MKCSEGLASPWPRKSNNWPRWSPWDKGTWWSPKADGLWWSQGKEETRRDQQVDGPRWREGIRGQS